MDSDASKLVNQPRMLLTVSGVASRRSLWRATRSSTLRAEALVAVATGVLRRILPDSFEALLASLSAAPIGASE